VGMALPEPKKYTVGFRVEVTDGWDNYVPVHQSTSFLASTCFGNKDLYGDKREKKIRG
jgi:hypothetical protein